MASSNPLADAAAALSKAKNFTKSVEGKEPSSFAPKPAAKPAADKTSAPAKTAAPTMGDELKAKADNVKQYGDAAPKYHDGGKIKKDGVQTIDAERGETVLPKDASSAIGDREQPGSGTRAGTHRWGPLGNHCGAAAERHRCR